MDSEATMNSAISRARRFVTSEEGPTTVEYAVMLAFIVLAIFAIVTNLGKTLSGSFSAVNSTFAS
jgi:pilus assembly protein Flp/PilA